jgi:hypothetical protein
MVKLFSKSSFFFISYHFKFYKYTYIYKYALSGWFANMVSSFAFVVIKGSSLIKIISARNQDIIMVYEAVIKVDIYGVGLENTRTQL